MTDAHKLNEFALFNNFPSDKLPLIAELLERTTFAKNEIIFTEGALSDGLYLIESGSISVLKNTDKGKQMEIAEIHEGQFFGEMALFDQNARSGTIQTREETTLLFLSRASFLHILANFPQCAQNVLNVLISRIREFQNTFLTEVREKNRILTESYDKLEKAERVRRQFVHVASHELKTPLTAIQMALYLLKNEVSHDENQNSLKLIKLSQTKIEQLSHLVDQIFELTLEENRNSAGKAKQKDQFLLVDPLKKAFSEIEFLAQGRDLTFHFIISDPHITLNGNDDKIEKIIFQLLHNAVKFSPTGKQITLSIDTENSLGKDSEIPKKVAVIKVIDEGIGIGPENYQDIFVPFFTIDEWEHHTSTERNDNHKNITNAGGGTGLGLSLVKHFSQMFNGTISIDSKPGKGTCFTLRLPV